MNKIIVNVLNTRDILEGELSKALEDSLKLDPGNLLEAKDILMGIRGNLESIIGHITYDIINIKKIYDVDIDEMADEVD